MRTNRLITRKDADDLDLRSRIKLEMEVTDTEAERVAQQTLPTSWDLGQYARRAPWRARLFDFLSPLAGQTVLDLGCGYNPTPIYFAQAGARMVYACDVSPKAAAYTKRLVDQLGIADCVSVLVCAGEELPLADETMDIVHGESTLHHLRLPLAAAEIARVLKCGGKGGFKDPLGHNPVLEFARDYLPYPWKKPLKGTDRPLRFRDIEEFAKHFPRCMYCGFGLLSTMATFIWRRNDCRPVQLAHAVDGHLLRRFAFLGRYCRFVVTCVQKTGRRVEEGEPGSRSQKLKPRRGVYSVKR